MAKQIKSYMDELECEEDRNKGTIVHIESQYHNYLQGMLSHIFLSMLIICIRQFIR